MTMTTMILDDFGFAKLSAENRLDLLEIIEDRLSRFYGGLRWRVPAAYIRRLLEHHPYSATQILNRLREAGYVGGARRTHRDNSEQVRSDRYRQFTWPVRQ